MPRLRRLLPLFLCLPLFNAPSLAEEPDYGNNNTCAHPIPVDGSYLEGALYPAGDQDWFAFTALANGLYDITLTSQSTLKTITIYRLDGLGGVSHITSFQAAACSATQMVFLYPGATYYAAVTNEEGLYYLSINELGAFPTDLYSDTCAAPTPLTVNAPPVSDGITWYGWDEDWFSFTTTALHTYRINLLTTAGCDTIVELRRHACGDMLYSTSPGSAFFTFVSVDGAEYDLRVRSQSFSNEGYYYLDVDDIDTSSDDHGNSHQQATAIIPNGTERLASIDYVATVGSDEDWFSFTGNAMGLYDLTITGQSGWKSYTLYRLQGTGQLHAILTNWDSAATQTIFLDTSGTYYLRISGQLGVYSLILDQNTIPAPDQYPDTCANAAPISPGGPDLADTIDDSGWDEDWFVFSAQPLHLYKITLEQPANTDIVYDIHHSDCSPSLHYADNETTLLSYSGGEFKLRLHSSSFDAQGFYTLSLTDLGLRSDDYPNSQPAAANILPNGQEYPCSIDYTATIGADEDWFTFEVRSLEPYALQITALTCVYVNVYQFDAENQLKNLAAFSNCYGGPFSIAFPKTAPAYLRFTGEPCLYSFSLQSPLAECGDASHPFPTADLNHDCTVDLKDLAIFTSQWLDCTHPDPPCNYNP